MISGLKLQGAQCRNNQLLLTSSIMTDLPVTLLRWTQLVVFLSLLIYLFFLSII